MGISRCVSFWKKTQERPGPYFGLMAGAAAVAARVSGKSVDEAIAIGYGASAAVGNITVGDVEAFRQALEGVTPSAP